MATTLSTITSNTNATNIAGTLAQKTAKVVVKAQSGATSTYTVVYSVTAGDSNSNLATLVCPQGNAFTPTFSPATINYTVTLPFGTTMSNDLLIATTQSSLATITVNYITGNRKIVQVKAQNNTSKLYTVTYNIAPNPALSVNENTENEFVIYPNPTKDKLFIKSETNIENVTIYNNEGKIVVKQNTAAIDIKHLAPGIYYLEVNQNKNRTTIIKE